MNATLVGAAILMVLLEARSARGQERVLTLADAQAEARAHAPDGVELRARLQGAQALAEDARRVFRRDPVLGATAFPGALTGRPEEFSANVGVSLPVDISGSWGPRGRSAAADAERVGFEQDDGLRALDEAVAIAVADLALAQHAAARAEQIAALYATASDAARRQLAVGSSTQLDVDGAELDLATARVALVQARGGIALVQTRLARLLGRTGFADLVVGEGNQLVESPPEPIEVLIERDPRVRAADANAHAARFELQTAERMIVPIPTFSLGYAYVRRDIPPGSFTGPGASGLSATWPDSELILGVSVPLPMFDRQTAPRALAHARIWAAEARAQTVRADVRSELQAALASLQSSLATVAALATVSATVERDIGLLDQALRAGSLDAVARAIALRRLEDAARRADVAGRDLRVARARWTRRTAGLR